MIWGVPSMLVSKNGCFMENPLRENGPGAVTPPGDTEARCENGGKIWNMVYNVPSGSGQQKLVAIEIDRNGGFSHYTWWIFP